MEQEVPPADLEEQRQPVGGPDVVEEDEALEEAVDGEASPAGGTSRPGGPPWPARVDPEVPEADALEQAVSEPFDEDERR